MRIFGWVTFISTGDGLGGYYLVSRRLEEGTFSIPLPGTDTEIALKIDLTELGLLLEGIELGRIRRKKFYVPKVPRGFENWVGFRYTCFVIQKTRDYPFFRARDYFSDDYPFFIGRVTHRPGDRVLGEPRRREFWKLAYVLAGHGSHQVGACRLALRPGAVYLVHPEDETAYHLGAEALTVWHALFLPTMVFPELSALGEQAATYQVFNRYYAQPLEQGRRLVLGVNERRPWPLRGQLMALQAEFDARAVHWRLRVRYLLVALLVDLSRQAAVGTMRVEAEEVGRFLVQYLARHYAAPLTLAVLARAAGYTPSHTSRLFHAQVGRPLFDYLLRLRVHAACERLCASHEPVRAIGQAVGFRAPSHFQRAFKALVGASPEIWRRRALPPPALGFTPPPIG